METDIFEAARLAGMSRRERQVYRRRIRRWTDTEFRERENAQRRAARARKANAAATESPAPRKRQVYDRRFRQWKTL